LCKNEKSRRLFHNAYLFGYDNENENPKTLKSTGGLQDVVARFTTHTILNDDGEVDDGDDGGGGRRQPPR
jgi:hypothetical protein